MDGAAHHGDPDRAPVGDQHGQVIGPESAQPGPQTVVGRKRGLGLQPDQVLDGRDDRGPAAVGLVGQLNAVQQQLPAEQGPVERSLAQHSLPAHRWKISSAIVWDRM